MKRFICFLCFAVLLSGFRPVSAKESAISIRPAPAAAARAVHPDTLFETVPANLLEQWEATWESDGRSIVTAPDGTVFVTDYYKRRDADSLRRLFTEGGTGWMGVITLLLVALLFAALKKPVRTRELGQLALCIGLLAFLVGLYGMSDALRNTGEIPARVVWSGLRICLIAPLYGLGVYLCSLLLRLIRKLRFS